MLYSDDIYIYVQMTRCSLTNGTGGYHLATMQMTEPYHWIIYLENCHKALEFLLSTLP